MFLLQNFLSFMPKPIKKIDLAQEQSPYYSINQAIFRASQNLLSHQLADGFWWYTLEANESINAEFIFLMHYLGVVDQSMQQGLSHHILTSQNQDGSWPLFYQGPGDLSTTIECYLALKIVGLKVDNPALVKARDFILSRGGLTQCRIFTRIHLALLGIVSWDICPSMPVSLMLYPTWTPFNIYEFSSWARASIVPLLIILDQKKNRQLGADYLGELYVEPSPSQAKWSYNINVPFLSGESFFLQADRLFKIFDRYPINPYRQQALKMCELWIRNHISRTEDIYPALAYSAMALHSLGFDPKHDPTIQKCLGALKKFQISTVTDGRLQESPLRNRSPSTINDSRSTIYQQCCISPVWDTPWAAIALLESGFSPDSSELAKTADWLVSKQIKNFYGDWAIKNKEGKPGGWSFEFENDFFPDVDDTIEVLLFLKKIPSPSAAMQKAIQQGIDWVISMQSKNGGWGAFDKDNTREWVNKIPFSDHGACLDPPTVDITGRSLELLVQSGFTLNDSVVKKAIRFIESQQEENGSWEGRWGVNYIYGTWCVLQGLKAMGYNMKSERILRSVEWLKSIQNDDGGFGESCNSYIAKRYLSLDASVPSQTAWALMGLIAAGETDSFEAKKAAQFLIESQDSHGNWEERYYTGTGFPGHFYIRYHGYRYYFPLLALAKYRNYFFASAE